MLLAATLSLAMDSASRNTEPTWTEVVDTIVGTFTAAFVVVAGGWALYRFLRSRTYKPRLEVTVEGGWKKAAGGHLLNVVIEVRNIGGSKVDLVQRGTGLDLYCLDRISGSRTEWNHRETIGLLEHHHWIEPGERVKADVIAPIDFTDEPVLARASLEWKRLGRRTSVTVVSDAIIWPGDPLPRND